MEIKWGGGGVAITQAGRLIVRAGRHCDHIDQKANFIDRTLCSVTCLVNFLSLLSLVSKHRTF